MTYLKPPFVLLAGAGLLFTTACTTGRLAIQGQHDSFGAANRANIEAHSVTPDPAKKADTYIPADRERVRAAREAYKKGEVKELDLIRSQSD